MDNIQAIKSEDIPVKPTPKPECPFCKQVRELLKGGLGMIRINR